MILHINSQFRNKTLFPYSTYFALPVNGTPPRNVSENDTRSIFIAQGDILFSFMYYDQLPITFFLYSSSHLLITSIYEDFPLTPSLFFFFQNTFVGVVLMDERTQSSSIITQSSFQAQGLLCTLENPLLVDASEIGIERKGVLLNPSKSLSPSSLWSHLLINGFSKYNFAPGQRQLQDDGISNGCFVMNLTQNRVFRIDSILQPYRNALLTPLVSTERDMGLTFVPPFQKGDYLIVVNPSSTVPSPPPLVTILDYSPRGVRRYRIRSISPLPLSSSMILIHSASGMQLRSRQTIVDPLVWKEAPVDHLFDRIHPGHFSHESQSPFSITLIAETHPSITMDIEILELSFSFQVQDVPPSVHTLRSKYVFFWLLKTVAIPVYAFVLEVDPQTRRVYTELPMFHKEEILQDHVTEREVDTMTDLLYSIGGFLLLDTFFPNVIYPVSHNSLQCYNVTLVSLTLPNRPICGSNQLLADFPYVFVNFGNLATTYPSTTAPSISAFSIPSFSNYSIGTMYSNIPSALHATFMCPIANIRNPDINQYVVVNSKQVVQIKLNFQEDLQFAVFLPSGALLLFSAIYSVSDSSINSNTIQSSPYCSLSTALNPHQTTSVYASDDGLYTSATFVLSPSS